jgi:hypothetical protein
MPLGDNKLSFTRKMIAGGLIILAFLLLGMWFWQFSQIMDSGPGVAQNRQKTDAGNNCQNGKCEGADPADKDKDTDTDGLSDWEEKNVHNTSPYLEDTDGDGLSDKKEVEKGGNPNCPEGRKCGDSEEDIAPQKENNFGLDKNTQGTIVDPTATSTLSASSTQGGLEAQDVSAENVDQELLKEIMEGNADPDKLRQVLTEAGMGQEILEQISDEQLIESYKQSLNNLE